MSVTKYWLDSEDRIVKTNLLWDNFAEDNAGGDRSFSDQIVGKSLFGFINGDSTKMFVSTMIQRVRITGKELEVDYRCDSPDLKRFMKMAIIPEEDGLIRVENSLEKEEPFRKSVNFILGDDGNIVKRCSMCQLLYIDNMWIDADKATEVLGAEEIPVIYTVCGSCKEDLEQRLKTIKPMNQEEYNSSNIT
ncbi:MAG: hypothetical protein AAFN93_06250 [Bacteroidota bacterium]